MKKFIACTAIVTALSFSAASAQAGGWGYNAGNNYSSGLVNVSPSVKTGDIAVLNGFGILNGSPIASGNVVKGILSDNGILGDNNIGLGILGSGSGLFKSKKGRR